MGNDAAETQSFFLPYCKRNQMEERIRLLLPEFYEAVQMQTVRQPIATWIAWIWPAVLFALFLVAGALLSVYYFPEFQKEIILGVLIFSIWMILLVLAYFLTAGSTVGVSHMAIVNGYFGRTICYISYKDIQYVEFSQNIFARVVKLQKGEVHLLASTANRKQEIPYISMENGETIKKRLLNR